jgi:hypothetical protein
MFKKGQQSANVDALNRSRCALDEKGTIDGELLYIDDFEGAFCWFSQFSQVWVSNVMADEDFIVEAEFMRNALAVFGIGGALRLCLFAVVDGVLIGSEGSWKNHIAVERKLRWTGFQGGVER